MRETMRIRIEKKYLPPWPLPLLLRGKEEEKGLLWNVR
jgi:hypothetical protein